MSEPVTGLVLSGGGAFAAYEVGIVQALVEGVAGGQTGPVTPTVVTGASAGSYNAALIASRTHLPPVEALAEVARVWTEEVAAGVCGNGVFRWRASPYNFLDWRCALASPLRFFWERVEDVAAAADIGVRWATALSRHPDEDEEQRILEQVNLASFLSTQPFPRLIRSTVDFEALQAGPLAVRCIATDWSSGELRTFGNDELTPSRGPLVVMASSAIPGLFSPVSIPPSWFVDGGVLMNTPLSPAIHAGATELHVVYLDPDIRRIPLAQRETTLGTLQRTLSIAMAGIMERDIEAACRINRGLELLHRYTSGALPKEDTGDLLEILQVIEEMRDENRAYRLVTIHRYHPSDLLGGPLGMLRFERPFIEALIARGYRDAVHHDCAVSGCLLPHTPHAHRHSGREATAHVA